MDSDLLDYLRGLNLAVTENQPMSKFSRFKTGGPARLYIEASGGDAAAKAYLALFKSGINFTVLGGCCNVLISDSGYDGAILRFSGGDDLTVSGTEIVCGGGVSGARVSAAAEGAGLTGAEFLSTIPGNVGGLIRMNAGCFGHEMKDIVNSVDCYIDDKPYTLSGNECEFAYRHSVFESCKNCLILRARLSLNFGEREKIRENIAELKQSRAAAQPVNLPSLGSVFKRQKGVIPAKLIDECGLKGMGVGGAEVSEKHSGFIVNRSEASSLDMFRLIQYIKAIIYQKYSVHIEEEIIYLGDFSYGKPPGGIKPPPSKR